MNSVRERFEQHHVLHTALSLFGCDAASARLIQQSERSFVFGCHQGSRDSVLRITHETHRTYDQVFGEIDWLMYLRDHGQSVACPLQSVAGQLVEKVEAGNSYFSCVLFEKAQGTAPKAVDWNAKLFASMGMFLGRMHALTQNYVASDGVIRRPSWSQEMDVVLARKLPPSEAAITGRYRDILHQLAALENPSDAFGLVHVDFHRGNFFVKDGQITLFDFDDCQYSWFVNDIAMAIFYAVPMDREKAETERIAKEFYTSFMSGYRREMHIEEKWLDYIPVFLKHRELDLYICQFDECGGNLGRLDKWGQTFMSGRKEKLEQDVPYLDIVFD